MESAEIKSDPTSPESRQNWVRFEEEKSDSSPAAKQTEVEEPYDGAVIETTQVHVVLDRPRRSSPEAPLPPPPPIPKPSPAPRNVPTIALRSHSSPAPVPTPASRPDPAAAAVMQATVRPPRPQAPQPPLAAQPMHNIPLQDIINGAVRTTTIPIPAPSHRNSIRLRQGFANGDTIVSLFPVNEKCPWLTRAEFRPELVPEELMAENLTLTVEEYVGAMEILVHDIRFSIYNMFYKRLLLFWILFSAIVLMVLLFSGVRGLGLFGGGVVWLLITAIGIFVCMWLKIRMSHHLERCMASVNKFFQKHKILVGLDDKGKLSCHKVNLIFIYFDCTNCVRKLQEVIDLYDKTTKTGPAGELEPARMPDQIQSRMDIDNGDIIITGGSTATHLSRRQERAEKLLLRYSQRWVKEYVRHRLDLTVDVHDRLEGEPPAQPRHCVHSRCPCQFIEEHLRYKPRGKLCGCELFTF